MSYRNIEDSRKYSKEWMRKKRAADPEFRERQKESKKKCLRKLRADPEFRKQMNEASNKYQRDRRANDPEFRKRLNEANKKRMKKHYANDPEYRKERKEHSRKEHARVRKESPWILHWLAARKRCNNPNHVGYKRYGAKGIQVLLTKNQMKILWFRDRANQMKKPSIDRINPDGNYCFDNCRFLELSENVRRQHYKSEVDGDGIQEALREAQHG